MKKRVLIAGSCLASLIGLVAAEVQPGTAAALPKMDFVTGHWDVAPETGALRPDPAIPWNLALMKAKPPAALSAELKVRVVDSGAFQEGRSPYGRFNTNGADLFGENDCWADAAMILGYDDSGKIPAFYRVEISAHPVVGNVAIWRTGGGYLAQKPLAIALKQEHLLQVQMDKQGTIRVALDGTEVLACRDPFPLKPGQLGVGALKGLVEFTGLTVQKLKEDIALPLPDQGNFKLRKLFDTTNPEEWWVFDGDEPVLRFLSKPNFEFGWVKVRPGIIPPVAVLPMFWTEWNGADIDFTKADGFTVKQEGATWEVEMKVKPQAGDAAEGLIRVKLTRDCQKLRYIYDVDTTLTVNKDKPMRYVHPVEFWDPWPHAAKGTLIEYDRSPRQRWDAIAWEQPDNQPPRRVDFANDWINLSKDAFGKWGTAKDYAKVCLMRPQGMAAMGLADDANLVMRYRNDPGVPVMNEMCAWGYDWHCRLVNDPWRQGGIPAGTVLNVQFTFSHEDKAGLQELFAKSKHIYEDWYKNDPRPVMEWPRNTFSRTVKAMSSHNSAIWIGGNFVTDRGNGDKFCMRLDPKNKLIGTLGMSQFVPRTIHHPNLRAMTFDVLIPEGEGKVSVLCRTNNPWNRETKQTFELSVAKSTGWQTFTVDASPYANANTAELEFENVGDKPFFVDNVSLEPAPASTKPVWVFEAEMLAGASPTPDPDARNGFALAVNEKHKKGACFFGPYDTELPAGEYEGTVRMKVADNTLATPVIGWDVMPSEGARPGVPASGNWKGTDFAAANAYEEKPITFKRPAGGRLQTRFYQAADGGKFWIDQIRLRRIKDGWGNPLPEKRDRW